MRNEFYKGCMALEVEWQRKFKWKQSQFYSNVIVADTKHKIAPAIVTGLPLAKPEKNKALYWIKEWNKSKVEERLINYSSIPVFSADKDYVLIVRGQDVRSEGGWDTIYIYKKVENKWVVWKRIRVSEI